MPTSTLTSHDTLVLTKIQDPESSPSSPVLIDASLPKDPHITDPSTYIQLVIAERQILSIIQATELQQPPTSTSQLLSTYHNAVTSLSSLIINHPSYASARNNRAQALRRIYGDSLLVSPRISSEVAILDPEASQSKLAEVSSTILSDLDTAIALLMPLTPFAALSPQAAKTLSQSFTQRGALYHMTAKALSQSQTGKTGAQLILSGERRESAWEKWQFEEAASRDLMMGGRHGNEIARNLAVATNPTAKLCGDIVREAMVRELGGARTERSGVGV